MINALVPVMRNALQADKIIAVPAMHYLQKYHCLPDTNYLDGVADARDYSSIIKRMEVCH